MIDDKANNMILGPGMYGAGVRATDFTRNDLGVAWLVGEGADPIIVQSHYVDLAAAPDIVARALAAKTAAGYDLEPDTEADIDETNILDDLTAIWPGRQVSEHSHALADRLADRWPRYEGWTADQLASALRPFEVEPRQVKRAGVNRRGFRRTDIEQALDYHHSRGSGPVAEG